jgi:putative hydrolase of HD superfamily
MEPTEHLGQGKRSGGIADFLYEVGHLKRTVRTGWALGRMANSESVADHTFRAAVIAMVMAAMVGANPDVAATITLLHDLPEARLGDMNHVTRRYFQEHKPFGQVIQDQTQELPAVVAAVISDRSQQWEAHATTEAVVARDADVIESILHVRESLSERRELQDRWVRYLSESIRTEVGQEVLKEILATDPDDWWPRVVTGE